MQDLSHLKPGDKIAIKNYGVEHAGKPQLSFSIYEIERVTNKQIADAFRVARFLIETEYHKFICFALPNTVTGGAARSVIETRIGSSAALGHWVRVNIPGALDDWENNPQFFTEQMRLYRLRWLDALIEEFDGA